MKKLLVYSSLIAILSGPAYASNPFKDIDTLCASQIPSYTKLVRRKITDNKKEADIKFTFVGGHDDGRDVYRCYYRVTIKVEDFQSGNSFSVEKDTAWRIELLTNNTSLITDITTSVYGGR